MGEGEYPNSGLEAKAIVKNPVDLILIGDGPNTDIYDYGRYPVCPGRPSPDDDHIYFDMWLTANPRLRVSAIGCTKECGSKCQPQPSIQKLVERTNGYFYSICTDDWVNLLADLGLRLKETKVDFPLSEKPIPESVVIKLNNVMVEEELAYYDEQKNAVVFAEPPTVHSVIEIDYILAGCSEL